jgi:uncharacterized protein (TIGR00369 family)
MAGDDELMSDFIVRDPDFEARIRDSFDRQGFMRHMGASIEELVPGRCVVSLPYRDEVGQQHGYFHGGAVGAVADNAGAYAAFTLIEAGQSMLTVEYKLNLLRPAAGERLRSVGQVIRAGRSLTVSQVDVFAVRDGGGGEAHCATALVTMMLLVGRGDS